MVNGGLHGERLCCMVNGSLTERPFACGSTAHRLDHGGVDRLEFPKSAIVPILIKYAASSPAIFPKST